MTSGGAIALVALATIRAELRAWGVELSTRSTPRRRASYALSLVGKWRSTLGFPTG